MAGATSVGKCSASCQSDEYDQDYILLRLCAVPGEGTGNPYRRPGEGTGTSL